MKAFVMICAAWLIMSGRPRNPEGEEKNRNAVKLGVIRLDYDYPPAPGDIDSPKSFAYTVLYRVVPGLTFTMAQEGKLTPEVEKKFIEAVKWLDEQGVHAITGDCGFMLYFQELARKHTKKPVSMSSLVQLNEVEETFHHTEMVAIFTANSVTLKPMEPTIAAECGIDLAKDSRFEIVGCQDVDGFEAVARGEKVDTAKVEPGIVQLAKDVLAKNDKIRGFLFECTELPAYSDAVRAATGLPVWDAITSIDSIMIGFQDNKLFGKSDWRKEERVDVGYKYGDNLSDEDKAKLVNKVAD